MVDLDYYDKLLVGIAGCVGTGAAIGLLTPIALHVGVFAGSIAATPFVYAALFQNPPLPETSPRVKVGAAIWHVFLVATFFAVVY